MWFYIVSMDPEASHQTATSHGRKGNGIYGKNQWSYTSISAWIPQGFYIYVRPAATISSSSSQAHGIISMNASIRIQNLYPSAPMMMQPTITVHIQINRRWCVEDTVCRGDVCWKYIISHHPISDKTFVWTKFHLTSKERMWYVFA